MEVMAAFCGLQFRFGGVPRHGQVVKDPLLAKIVVILQIITVRLYYRKWRGEVKEKRVGCGPGSNLGSLGSHSFRQSKPRPSRA